MFDTTRLIFRKIIIFRIFVYRYSVHALCIIPSVQVKVKCKASCAQGEVQKGLYWLKFPLSICSLDCKANLCLPFSLLHIGILAAFPCCTEINYPEMANFDMFVKKYVLCLL